MPNLSSSIGSFMGSSGVRALHGGAMDIVKSITSGMTTRGLVRGGFGGLVSGWRNASGMGRLGFATAVGLQGYGIYSTVAIFAPGGLPGARGPVGQVLGAGAGLLGGGMMFGGAWASRAMDNM